VTTMFEGIKLPLEIVEYLADFPEEKHEEELLHVVYSEIPVPMPEYILSENYLNLSRSIHPKLVPLLTYVDHMDIRDIDLILGRGSGKTTASAIIMSRSIYRLMCYRDARAFLGKIPGEPIVCLNVSVSQEQAKDGVFATLKAITDGCQWFEDKYKAITQKIRFEGQFEVICGHSKSTTWLGHDIFCGVLDEANFLIDKKDQSNAEDLWKTIRQSCFTRFPNHYKMVSISSSKDGKDFMSRKTREIREDPANLIELSEAA